MGEVYRATDTKLGRDVAIKVLPAELAQDAGRRRPRRRGDDGRPDGAAAIASIAQTPVPFASGAELVQSIATALATAA